MSAPLVVYVEHSATSVYVWFDRDIARVNTSLPWSDGFTITVNSVAATPTSVTKVTNGLVFAVPFAVTDTISVAYNGANLVDAATGAHAVAAVTKTSTLAVFDPDPHVLSYAVVQPSTSGPQTILVALPYLLVSPQGLAAQHPFVVLANDVPATIQSVAYHPQYARTYLIALTQPISAGASVAVRVTPHPSVFYARTGAAVTETTQLTAWNSSSFGLPTSAFGTSCIMCDALTVQDSVITASVRLFLNPVDRDLALRYAPVWDPSGSFAAQPGPPPTAYTVSAPAQRIYDGAVYKQQFTHANLVYARQAAVEWQQAAVVKIQFAINSARQLHQAMNISDTTYTYV